MQPFFCQYVEYGKILDSLGEHKIIAEKGELQPGRHLLHFVPIKVELVPSVSPGELSADDEQDCNSYTKALEEAITYEDNKLEAVTIVTSSAGREIDEPSKRNLRTASVFKIMRLEKKTLNEKLC